MTHKGFCTGKLCQFVAGATLAIFVIFTERAYAEITDSAPNGFSVRETAHVAATADKVYSALVAPQKWWSPKHTFSGDAANLSLDTRPGGCWCETLPSGGSVEHMTVVYAVPGKALRMRGAMGPFQLMGAQSALDYSLTSSADGTDVTISFAVGGYSKEGLDKLAPIVDRVYAEQLGRLKSFVETGSVPNPKEMKP